MYVGRPRLILGLGLLLIPIAFAITLLQWLLLEAVDLAGVVTGEAAGSWAFVATVIGATLTLLGLGARHGGDRVRARGDRRGANVGPVGAYRVPARLGACPSAPARVAALGGGLGRPHRDRLPHPGRALARRPLVRSSPPSSRSSAIGARSGRCAGAVSSSADAGSASDRSSASAPRSHFSSARFSARSSSS